MVRKAAEVRPNLAPTQAERPSADGRPCAGGRRRCRLCRYGRVGDDRAGHGAIDRSRRRQRRAAKARTRAGGGTGTSEMLG